MSETTEKGQGFTVIDRRGVEREPVPEPAPAPAVETKPEPESRPVSKGPRPPIDFTTFVFSFASSALVQMGAAPDPDTGKPVIDLDMARESIDLLGMLREKTRGNLTPEETKFFDAVLYDLRVRFVEATKPKS